MRSALTTVLELVGLAMVAGGCWLFDYRLGIIVAGLLLVFFAFLTDEPAEQ